MIDSDTYGGMLLWLLVVVYKKNLDNLDSCLSSLVYIDCIVLVVINYVDVKLAGSHNLGSSTWGIFSASPNWGDSW